MRELGRQLSIQDRVVTVSQNVKRDENRDVWRFGKVSKIILHKHETVSLSERDNPKLH